MPEAVNRLLILVFGLALALGSAMTVRRVGLRLVHGTARGLAPPPRLLPAYILATPGAAVMALFPLVYFFWPPVHGLLRPIPALAQPWLAALGGVLVVLGSAGIVAALAQLGAAARVGLPQERTELVRRGLYAVSRNPVYVSLLAALLGIALLTPSIGLLVGWPCFLARVHLRVLAEERYLAGAFGPAYADYRRRVGRYATLRRG